MMPRPIIIEVNEFRSGLITGQSPRLIPIDAATSSTNVDYSNGSLSGLYAPYSWTSGSAPANTRFIHLTGPNGWTINSSSRGFSCYDASSVEGTDSPSVISYYSITGGVGQPHMVIDNTARYLDEPLGVSAQTCSVANGSAGQPRAYKTTKEVFYKDLKASWESNPSDAVTVTKSTNAVISFSAAGTNTTEKTYYTNIYATQVGTTDAPYYYLGTVSSTTTSFTDLPYSLASPVKKLDWAYQGSFSNPVYKYDHSDSPILSVISNGLLSVVNTPEAIQPDAYKPTLANYIIRRNGILFGGYGQTLYWSANGYPWYWPYNNRQELDGTIEAIIVDRSIAYVFTQRSIYVITGSDDQSLTVAKTLATHPCWPNGGNAVKQTPYGIIYPSILGLALFDGQNSSIITDGILQPGAASFGYDSSSYIQGAYVDNSYVISSDKAFLVNLLSYPKITITQLDQAVNFKAMENVPNAIKTGVVPGLYVYSSSDNYIRYWTPRQGGTGYSNSRFTWKHTTGQIDAGSPDKKKRFIRFWPSDSQGVTYLLKCYNWNGGLVSSCSLGGAGWLPRDFIGDYITVQISPSVDAAEICHGFRIEAEVYD